jgi:hypothetical protein
MKMLEKRNPSRLSPSDRKQDLLPWRRAIRLKRCFLYWLPTTTFPLPHCQKEWTRIFIERWAKALEGLGMRSEVFLQVKAAQAAPLKDALLKTCLDLIPVMGLGRKPGESLPRPVNMSDVEAMQKGTKKFNVNDYLADYAYWFLDKSRQRQVELFFGWGGLTLMFLKPDANTQPPKINIPVKIRNLASIEKMDLDRMMACACSLKDEFPAKSKKLFGADLQESAQFPGLLFIIPIMESRHFFEQPEEVVSDCFRLCDMYLNESPQDGGILLAFKRDLEDQLIEVLGQMKNEGFEYPEN